MPDTRAHDTSRTVDTTEMFRSATCANTTIATTSGITYPYTASVTIPANPLTLSLSGGST